MADFNKLEHNEGEYLEEMGNVLSLTKQLQRM